MVYKISEKITATEHESLQNISSYKMSVSFLVRQALYHSLKPVERHIEWFAVIHSIFSLSFRSPGSRSAKMVAVQMVGLWPRLGSTWAPLRQLAGHSKIGPCLSSKPCMAFSERNVQEAFSFFELEGSLRHGILFEHYFHLGESGSVSCAVALGHLGESPTN
jgi:hypothetical protein